MPNKVWVGVLGGFGLAGLTLLLSTLLGSEIYVAALVLIGVSQLVLALPALLIAWKSGKRELFKGLLIGAGVVFLLNAACFGLLMVVGVGY